MLGQCQKLGVGGLLDAMEIQLSLIVLACDQAPVDRPGRLSAQWGGGPCECEAGASNGGA